LVDDELGLKARQVRVHHEATQGAAQLVGLGTVLGIVDDDEIAAQKRNGVVERLGLCARTADRY
jgi:hypothetical protein